MKDKVIKMIAKKLCKKTEAITLDSRLVEDLGADSLDVVDLLMLLEDEYHLTIPNDEAIKLKTIGDIVTFLEKQTTCK